FSSLAPWRVLLPFPTRRSSDLRAQRPVVEGLQAGPDGPAVPRRAPGEVVVRPAEHGTAGERGFGGGCGDRTAARYPGLFPRQMRSEEHTSELQSRVDLVCRLRL